MNLLKYIFFFITSGSSLLASAQDSAETFSAQQVMDIVNQFHPVAKQADIFIQKARANVTIAKGMFDPYIGNSLAQKTFDGTNYYYYNRPELSIPTWFGIEVSTGLEYLSGNRTDPVETKGQSSYLGISVPLAKNVLMDKRRAALQTAKIFRTSSLVEKRNILNNLLLDAMTTYWSWVEQYQVFKVLSNAVTVNEKRVALVKSAFTLGDRPAIDTTEALTQLQNFQMLRSQAWLNFQNTTLELSVFLWTPSSQPYQLPITIIPADNLQTSAIASAPLPDVNSLLDAARKNHPELIMYDYKLNALAVEKKLKFQELLPSIDFQYNRLSRDYDILKTVATPLFENNFQYGLSFGIPLRLSRGRGEYRMAKLDIAETQLQKSRKVLDIETKVNMYFNELVTLKAQTVLQEKALINYQALQRGEEIRFQAGESSLFLINARETKTLEALQKLQELTAKYFKATVSLQWAAGLLIQ